MWKKRISVVLILAFVLSVFTGCGSGTAGDADAEGDNTETRIVVDHTGAEVEIPAEIDRVVITSITPLPSVYCLYRGSTDGLVGLSPSAMAAAENSFLTSVYPELTDITTEFYTGDEINLEELMALEPDVVFYRSANTAEKEMYENAGIPAVGFSVSLADYNSVETYVGWIELLGQIYGDDGGKTAEMIELSRTVEADILERTATLADADKPRALILYQYDASTIKVSGSNFFGQYWLETTGAINVASELSGSPSVNMEQIYEWNPDMIFITNFSATNPEDLINNTIEGHDWSNVKAVQDGKVYKFPLGMYRWFPPSSDTPLALMWLAKQVQPELFADIDMDQEIKDYFIKYYQVELTDEDIQIIYNPAREAAGK